MGHAGWPAPAAAGKGAGPRGRVAPGWRGWSAARGALIVVRAAVAAAVADGGRRGMASGHRRPVPGIVPSLPSAVVSAVSALRGGGRGWAAALPALRRRLDGVEDALEIEVGG